MDAPHEQEYADGLYPSFTLVFTLDRATGNYMVYCPEWKCELSGGKHPGHSAYGLIMEIVGHNEEEMKHGNAETVPT